MSPTNYALVGAYGDDDPGSASGSAYVYGILTQPPPDPTHLANTIGNYWVNYTWQAGTGTGNVTEVTIDHSSIGGLSDQPMTHFSGDVWEVTTNATEVTINVPDFTHQLTITATDNDGGISDPVILKLTVLKRCDVNGDGLVNKMDADYISRYLAGLELEASNPPDVLVGDVVDEAGDPVGNGVVDLMDALHLAKYTEGMAGEP